MSKDRNTNVPAIVAGLLLLGFLSLVIGQMFLDLGHLAVAAGSYLSFLAPVLPYLTGIVVGGLLGNLLYDSGYRLSGAVFATLGIALVAAIAGDAHYLNVGPFSALLVVHGLTGFLLAFPLCAGGIGDTTADESIAW